MNLEEFLFHVINDCYSLIEEDYRPAAATEVIVTLLLGLGRTRVSESSVQHPIFFGEILPSSTWKR